MIEPDRMPTLYRYFDAEGRLLYIGVTVRHLARMMQHARASRWWPLAVSCTLEHFDDVEAMYAAELVVIRTEAPLYNVNGAPRRYSIEEKAARAAARRKELEDREAKRVAAARREWRRRRYPLQASWSRLMEVVASGVDIF